MSPINLLNISRNSLEANQFALGVTSANVANIHTPGYSRQRPVFLPKGMVSVEESQISLVVNVAEVTRTYDSFLELQTIAQNQAAGYSREKQALLERLETVFEESQGGRLGDALDRFFNAWSDLAANPNGRVERQVLLSVTDTLTRNFHDYARSIEDINRYLAERMGAVLQSVNQVLAAIADNNDKLGQIARDVGQGNLLRDQRMEYLKELAGYLPINFYEDDRGLIHIQLPSGRSLVDGNNYERLRPGLDGRIYLEGQPGVSLYEELIATERGEVAAIMQVRDRAIPEYRAKLDNMAASLITTINDIHRQGFDQGGNRGTDFFVPAATAREIRLNINDLSRLAASATVNQDGGNARRISALKDDLIIDGTSTVGQFLASLVAKVGQDLAEARSLDRHRQLVLNNIRQRREEVSGVSIDEEMMNLMKYQLGYNAAGRLANTASELLETLLRLGT